MYHQNIFNLTVGKSEETFLALEAPAGLSFLESVDRLLDQYEEVSNDSLLSMDTAITIFFYVSDITNQERPLRVLFDIRGYNGVFISIIGQAPASGSKIALQAYHINSSLLEKKSVTPQCFCVNHGQYKSIWNTLIPNKPGSAYEQTHENFSELQHHLTHYNASIRDNLIRTWIIIHDIDNHYHDMVKARNEIFMEQGLTKDTHFIASTGIEGNHRDSTNLIAMHSLTICGLQEQQVQYLEAPEFLNPTHEYGVTFERGTRILYGDRSHYYISGTASIDNKGDIMHEGNVGRQTQRTLSNIDALLKSGGASFNDLKMLVIYLRDISDYTYVTNLLKNILPKDVAYVVVRGAVCRPLWLIEIEGIAIKLEKNVAYPDFCKL